MVCAGGPGPMRDLPAGVRIALPRGALSNNAANITHIGRSRAVLFTFRSLTLVRLSTDGT